VNTTIKQYGDGTQLVQLVRDMVVSLDRLGFGDEDAPVDGGDCVELMGAMLPQLREALAGYDRLLSTQRGARDMLREAAKQFRLNGDSGHATMCDLHAKAVETALAALVSGGAEQRDEPVGPRP